MSGRWTRRQQPANSPPNASPHLLSRSTSRARARWQERIELVQRRLIGGCHLTRRIPDLVDHAGFVIDHMETYYLPRDPKISGYIYEGQATRPTIGPTGERLEPL